MRSFRLRGAALPSITIFCLLTACRPLPTTQGLLERSGSHANLSSQQLRVMVNEYAKHFAERVELSDQILGFMVKAGVAEVQRAPFDMAEGESEIIGFHVEYSGMLFGVFSMAEYANMILVSTLTAIMFFGGWAAPLDSAVFNAIPGFFWLLAKVLCVLFMFLWIRATFPRFRYDQIMRLGWKVFLPLTIVWLVLIAAWMQTPFSIWR